MKNKDIHSDKRNSLLGVEINRLLCTQVKVAAIFAFILSVLSLIFEVKYLYNGSGDVFFARLGWAVVSLAALLFYFSPSGKKRLLSLLHLIIFSMSVSFGVIIYLLPDTLTFNSQILSLLIFASALYLSWDYKDQIIVAIYFNLIFGAVVLLKFNELESISNLFESLVFIVFISLLSIAASAISYKLRKLALYRKIEVEESDKKYKDIFENSAEGIYRSTLDGKFLIANPALVNMLGYENEEEVQNLDIVKDVYANSKDREMLQKMLIKQGIVKNYRIRLKRKDKSEIIVRANVRLIKDENGETQYFEGSLRNISQQVIAENERQKALNQIRKAKIESDQAAHKAIEESSFKTQYLASMSHEIRTPINAVISALEILGNDMYSSKEELHEYVRTARVSAESLLDILNNILDLSKINAGKMELAEVEFDIREEVDRAVSILSSAAKAKNIRISFTVDDDIPERLLGDPTRYRQILVNLVSNAVKYTERGEVIVSLKYGAEKDDRIKLLTIVRDTGIGIPAEKIKQLFEPFTQIRDKSKKGKGTGLGLVISKEFIKLMGGQIEVDSKEGIGSRFKFTVVMKMLPAEREDAYDSHAPLSETAESEADTDIKKTIESRKEETADISPIEKLHSTYSELDAEFHAPASANSARNSTPSIPEDKNKKRLLLVEDNPISQQLEMKILNEIGYFVYPVSNGVQAIQALEANHFDLVLMDIEMPEMDGLTATKKIRESSNFGNIPIIAVTAHSSMKDREKCLAAGMDDYMAKPISIHFLKMIIDKWLHEQR